METHERTSTPKDVEEPKMGVPYMTSFCCCLGLEVGTKLVAVVYMLISVVLMALCISYAEQFRMYVGTVEDEDQVYRSWYIITVVVAVVTLVHVLLHSFLLYSACKRYTTGIRVWVCTMSVLYVLSLLYVGVSLCFGVSQTGSDMFVSFLVGVLFYGIVGYCIICVNSFYLMLTSTEDMEGPTKIDY